MEEGLCVLEIMRKAFLLFFYLSHPIAESFYDLITSQKLHSELTNNSIHVTPKYNSKLFHLSTIKIFLFQLLSDLYWTIKIL